MQTTSSTTAWAQSGRVTALTPGPTSWRTGYIPKVFNQDKNKLFFFGAGVLAYNTRVHQNGHRAYGIGAAW